MVEIERNTESGLGMYTQCPDCEIAFRVTAEVLKQAAGKVRCGNCGNAFNALAYLSEEMPKQPAPQAAGAAVPELKAEIIETDNRVPHSISAEQSAALLKTLDELAGSDIRIEDTGVEWRVLDEDEAAAPAADDDDAGVIVNTTNVDEYLDDARTPIDEFLTATPEVVDSPEIFEDVEVAAVRTSVDELRFDDNTPLPDDFGLNDDSLRTPDIESERFAPDEETDEPAAVEEPVPEFALSEPDEWNDILGEFEDLVDEVAASPDALVEDDATDEDDAVDADLLEEPAEISDEDKPLDMDTQFALQAEAMGIDLSGINEIEPEDDELVDELEDLVEDLEQNVDEDLDEEPEPELEFDLVDEPEDELEDEPEDELEDELEDEPEDELEQLDLIDRPSELIEEPVVEAHSIEAELDSDAAESVDIEPEEGSDKHFVPPMTEAEHTVNMQIDEDLMALAIEDDDGFASTIVMHSKDAEKIAREENAEKVEDGLANDDGDELFETIIMEGESVRSEHDTKKLAADVAAAAELAEIARAAEAEQAAQSGGSRYGMIGGIVVLVIVLGLQAMHQSREALATIPAFSNTVGQVYRAIGQPVQPAWDITGWRIEASNDTIQVEEGEENLTVYSRIGNDSDGPLPYPLVSISLTDRFLETLGNQVLDPAEYLPTDLDPRKLVEPGNTFNAIISIKAPPIEASGYKVDVCYRMTDGQLRCKANDFK